MRQPRMQPAHESPPRQYGGHSVSDDDIELPPVPRALPSVEASSSQALSNRVKWPKGLIRTLWAVALLVSIPAASWFLHQGNSVERGHPNWKQVAAATEASAGQKADVFVRLDSSRAARVVPLIEVSASDVDQDTTHAVRRAARSRNLEAATEILRAAQRVPLVSGVEHQEPELDPDPELLTAIKDGSTQFFHLHLFDCCDEDGDVVQVVVNGQPFMTVPIMHQGATVTVPLASGSNTVSLRGIQDGGGGITVSIRTSQGEYFCKRMVVGEEHHMGVFVQ